MDDRVTMDPPPARLRRLAPWEWLAIGLGSGLFGGLALIVPVALWDWARSGHEAFELPMAATAWIFGLQHFSQEIYLAWPMLVGGVLLAAGSALAGLAFTGLADRVFALRGLPASVAGGLAWAFLSFVFFWDVLLSLGRDGAPLRATTGSRAFVAPNWVWILGFALLGLVTGIGYWRFRRSLVRDESDEDSSNPSLRAA